MSGFAVMEAPFQKLMRPGGGAWPAARISGRSHARQDRQGNRSGDIGILHAELVNRAGGSPMLTWAIIALVIALIAGALGFTGVAAAAGTVAKVLFGLFLAIAILLFVLSLFAVA
jgi:uncharacterized membrane protein YtjA (UPF0391 family)